MVSIELLSAVVGGTLGRGFEVDRLPETVEVDDDFAAMINSKNGIRALLVVVEMPSNAGDRPLTADEKIDFYLLEKEVQAKKTYILFAWNAGTIDWSPLDGAG